MKLEKAIQTQGFKCQQQKAAVNLMYTAYYVKSAVSNALKAYGLTPEQYNVLRILKGRHPEQMCVRDIASRLIERSSNVPRILDRLEGKKLVKRATSALDKRETVIELTQASIRLLHTVNAVVEKVNIQSCGLNEVELKQLNNLLDRFRID